MWVVLLVGLLFSTHLFSSLVTAFDESSLDYEERTCDTKTLKLVCPSGYDIEVRSVFYGRDEQTSCLDGHGDTNVTSCRSLETAFKSVKQRCNHRESCILSINPETLDGDPCPHVSKLFRTHYYCVQPTLSALRCENAAVVLQCTSPSVIFIKEARYGRQDNVTCITGSDLKTPSCLQGNATDILKELCNYKSTCDIYAKNNLFGNRCPGTSNYLQVNYTCIDCVDLWPVLDDCLYWRERGECNNNKPWMLAWCRRTCLNCQYAETCQNSRQHDSQCDMWAGEGQCIKKPDWMNERCQRSCNWCPQTPVDNDIPQAPEDSLNVTACEGNVALLLCEQNQGLRIYTAFYGRKDEDTCPHGSISDTDCFIYSLVTDRVKWTCEGRESCFVSARPTAFSHRLVDPCPGTYKYLQVMYQCQACVNAIGNNSLCEEMAHNKACEKEKKWMLDNCFRTCTQCQQSDCSNKLKEDEDCDFWASRGECEVNPIFMTLYCQESCRKCPRLTPRITAGTHSDQPCQNAVEIESDCEKWVSWGQCVTNEGWMLENCYKACTRCDYTGDVFSTVTCEGSSLYMMCPQQKVIFISEAFYGRRDRITCPHATAAIVTNCTDLITLQKFRKLCNAKQTCKIDVTVSVLGEPCSGTFKYTTVDYMCVDLSSLTCSDGCVHGECLGDDHCFCDDGYKGSTCSEPDCSTIDECNDHGTCTGPNECRCETGYSGSTCSDPDCSRLDQCNSHGVCTAPNVCKCDTGYTGTNCNQSDCSTSEWCSGHGTCVGPETCKCIKGYNGTACNQPDCSMLDECTGHGVCGAPAECHCQDGWTSLDCSIPVCTCTGHSRCIQPNVCACEDEWTGELCDTPLCTAVNSCSGHGYCSGPSECVCEDKWTGIACNIPTCLRVNNCSGHGRCQNPDECLCETTWIGDDCSVPRCLQLSNCNSHGRCVSPNVCLCDEGWTMDDCAEPLCIDVNNCSAHGRCVAPGTCKCYEGWGGSDCNTPLCLAKDNCSDHGHCVGPDICSCEVSWTGSKCATPLCSDVNNCMFHGICVAPGICECNVGWGGTDCGTPRCSDLSDCSLHGVCKGPNLCECTEDWAGDDCTIPLCTGLKGCSSQGTCLAPNDCQCNEGWTGDDCSIPLCNELTTCSGHGRCVFGNRCLCFPYFIGDDCSLCSLKGSRACLPCPVCLHGTCIQDAEEVSTSYMGCYEDDADDLDLNHLAWKNTLTNTYTCMSHCQQNGYLYAGTQNGSSCYCGNTFGRYKPSRACVTVCSDGNEEEICGGHQANSVWKTSQGICECDKPNWTGLLCDKCSDGYHGPDCIFSSTNTFSTTAFPKTVKGKIALTVTMDKEWKVIYKDSTVKETQTFLDETRTKLIKFYSTIMDNLLDVVITGLRQGSVIVDHELLVSQSVNSTVAVETKCGIYAALQSGENALGTYVGSLPADIDQMCVEKSGYCKHGGTVTKAVDGKWMCQCKEGMFGRQCQYSQYDNTITIIVVVVCCILPLVTIAILCCSLRHVKPKHKSIDLDGSSVQSFQFHRMSKAMRADSRRLFHDRADSDTTSTRGFINRQI